MRIVVSAASALTDRGVGVSDVAIEADGTLDVPGLESPELRGVAERHHLFVAAGMVEADRVACLVRESMA